MQRTTQELSSWLTEALQAAFKMETQVTTLASKRNGCSQCSVYFHKQLVGSYKGMFRPVKNKDILFDAPHNVGHRGINLIFFKTIYFCKISPAPKLSFKTQRVHINLHVVSYNHWQ